MKPFAFVLLVLQAVLVQHCFSQCIRGCGGILPTPLVSTPTVVTPSVANTLADTLSLLTVSSLLAETLPLTPNVVATVPVPVAQAPCGCSLGCGYTNGLGCGFTNGLGCGYTNSLGCGYTNGLGCGCGNGLRCGYNYLI